MGFSFFFFFFFIFFFLSFYSSHSSRCSFSLSYEHFSTLTRSVFCPRATSNSSNSVTWASSVQSSARLSGTIQTTAKNVKNEEKSEKKKREKSEKKKRENRRRKE